MTRAIQKEVREKIVSAYENGLATIKQLAEIFNVGERTINRYLHIYRETGDLTPQTQPGRPPIITEEKRKLIEKIVLANPDGRLTDYRDKFYEKTGIEVTIVTIHNVCNQLDLRRKKKLFLQQNKNVRTYKKKEQIT